MIHVDAKNTLGSQKKRMIRCEKGALTSGNRIISHYICQLGPVYANCMGATQYEISLLFYLVLIYDESHSHE